MGIPFFCGSVLKQCGEYLRLQPSIYHKVYLNVNPIAKGFAFLEDIFFLVSCQISGKNNQLEKRPRILQLQIKKDTSP